MQSAPADPTGQAIRVVGRYALYGELAAGGMATVHFGRLLGPVGFSRTVAIKRLHPQFAKDPEFVSMFLDEARLAARIQHPNVVQTVDVVALDGELFLVMEYVAGESLSKLVKAARKLDQRMPPRIAAAVMVGMLHGLHAAHTAKSERGEPLQLVHRDISPQNVLVGTDGVSRVLDFGVAKAAARAQSTRDGQMKGKMSYMSPEQLGGDEVDARTDIFASGVVLWEALTGERLFSGGDAGELFGKVLKMDIPPPSRKVPTLPRTLDKVLAKALARRKEQRYETARGFAIALEKAAPIATAREVGEWVEKIYGSTLEERATKVATIESQSSTDMAGLPEELSSPSRRSAVPTEESSAPSGVSGVSAPSAISGPPSGVTSPSSASARTGAEEQSPSSVTSPSQMSQVSFATPHQPDQSREAKRKQKRRGIIAVAIAAVVAVGIGFGAMSLATRVTSDDAPAAAAQPPATEPAKEPVAEEKKEEAAEPEPEPAPEPDSDETAVVDPSELETEPEPEPPPAPLPPSKAKPAAPARVRPPPAAPPPKAEKKKEEDKKANCSPPFFIDSKGIKRPKPGCL